MPAATSLSLFTVSLCLSLLTPIYSCLYSSPHPAGQRSDSTRPCKALIPAGFSSAFVFVHACRCACLFLASLFLNVDCCSVSTDCDMCLSVPECQPGSDSQSNNLSVPLPQWMTMKTLGDSISIMAIYLPSGSEQILQARSDKVISSLSGMRTDNKRQEKDGGFAQASQLNSQGQGGEKKLLK